MLKINDKEKLKLLKIINSKIVPLKIGNSASILTCCKRKNIRGLLRLYVILPQFIDKMMKMHFFKIYKATFNLTVSFIRF